TAPPTNAATVKLAGEVPVLPITSTVIDPDVAPAGTVVTIWVAVELVTTASVPLNFTMLSVGVVLNSDPVMVTVVPGSPNKGATAVMAAPGVTVKLAGDVAVLLPTITVTDPVVAPAGTVVTIWVAVELVTTAAVPLNITMLLAGVVLKLVPVMVTVVPGGPEDGAREVIVGAGVELLLPQPASRTVIAKIMANK
ncbi:MAG: hypothetical protein WCA04_09220, partial [Geobacteraceae bacterium]